MGFTDFYNKLKDFIRDTFFICLVFHSLKAFRRIVFGGTSLKILGVLRPAISCGQRKHIHLL